MHSRDQASMKYSHSHIYLYFYLSHKICAEQLVGVTPDENGGKLFAVLIIDEREMCFCNKRLLV